MEYIDLTHKLDNKIPVFPGDPDFKLNPFKKATKEDSSNIYEISGSLHSGTHIDSPFHYIENGKKVLDLKLENLIGIANVLNYNKNEKEIYFENIKNPLEKIIILNTSWSNNWGSDNYFTENPYLSKEFANTLLENNVQGIAIDTPSVDKFGKSIIHKILLKNNIWIVENLNSRDKLIKNKYNAFFIPLKINADASFVRAFLKK